MVSAKGSPGVTTAALALTLAWPRPVLLAELDPRGGDVLWGYGRGQNVGGAGLLRLQLAARSQPVADAVWSEVLELPGVQDRWWLPGLLEPRQVGTVDWQLVTRLLCSLDSVDVIADCGSVHGPGDRMPRSVWAAADLLALAVRPTLPGVHAALNAAPALRADLSTGGLGPERLVSVVISATQGYPTKQVAGELDEACPVLGELPADADTAATLAGLRDQRRRFDRSPLMRGARRLAAVMGTQVLHWEDAALTERPTGLRRLQRSKPAADPVPAPAGAAPAAEAPGPLRASAAPTVVHATAPPPVPRSSVRVDPGGAEQ